MQIELNRATFRRLVQLYILSTIALFVTILYLYRASSRRSFEEDFDTLVLRHFNQPLLPEWLEWTVAGVGLVGGLWMFASIFGLLRYKRWARLGIWASLIMLFGSAAILWGMSPSTATILDDALVLVDSALLGAILLLSYAKGYGAEWFGRPTQRLED